MFITTTSPTWSGQGLLDSSGGLVWAPEGYLLEMKLPFCILLEGLNCLAGTVLIFFIAAHVGYFF